MKITHKQLRQIIEETLKELDVMSPGVDIMMPGSGRAAPGIPSGSTPFQKPRELEGEIPDDIKRGAEILIGFTPVGIAVDFKDLATAIEENDPVLAIAAGIGFIPVVGDLFKVPYKTGRASAKQAKYLKKLEEELGPEGIKKLRDKTSDTAKATTKASRAIRVLEPNVTLDANDDFRKAVYPIVVDGSEYVVTLIKRSYGAPIQVSFNVPGAEAFKMTGQGNVMRVVDGVFKTVKDFNKRFPGEKSFSFTGAVQGGPRPMPGEATKRARVFSGLLQRKISRDPELAVMVKKIRDASWAGDANTWKIDLHELRQIIREEVESAKGNATQALGSLAQDKVEKALGKITADTKTLSDLLGKGEVSVDVGDAKVTIKTEKAPVKRALEDIGKMSPDDIAKSIKTDIKDLDIIVQKRVGKGKRITGNIINPFNPGSRGFNISLKGKW